MINVLPSVQLCNVTWGCQTICVRYKNLRSLTELIRALDTWASIWRKHSGLLALAWESSTQCTLTLWHQEYVRAYMPWFVCLCRMNIHWTHTHFYVSFIISITYFCIRDVYITLRDTNMSTLGKKLKVYLNFPSFRLTCFSCSFAKIKEVKYSLSFTLRYSFHSSRGTQKCPNPLLLHSCFFPKFSALMQSLQLRWWPCQAV